MKNGYGPTAGIAERNRQNSLHSTGPRTAEGKAIARRNSVRHGLAANPAASAVRDGGVFEALQQQLVEAIEPRNVVEEGLVQQIAVALWRLQRAAQVEAATTGLAADRIEPAKRTEVQKWIERINAAWRIEMVPERDREVLARLKDEGRLEPGGTWWKRCRPGLAALDRIREEQIMPSGPAINAMMVMLGDLAQKLEDDPGTLMPHEAEQLAWLLGESADRLPFLEGDVDYPDRMLGARSVDELIGRARSRRREEPVPPEMALAIERRLTTLRQQREMCEEPYTSEADEQRRTAALLPDAATLDRLLRYENHAERSLKRALDTLAQLRGEASESFCAVLFATRGQQTLPFLQNGHGRGV